MPDQEQKSPKEDTGQNTDTIELLRNMLNSLGVDMRRIKELSSGLEEFDGGIRRQLFIDYDYGRLACQIEKNCCPGTIYIVKDSLEVQYAIFQIPIESKVPESKTEIEYILIGPYVNVPVEEAAHTVVRRYQLPLFHISTLRNYFYSIPVFPNVEAIVLVFIESIYGKGAYHIDQTGMLLSEEYHKDEIRLEDGNSLSMDLIEERYQAESRLLEAVAQGDATKARLCLAALGKYTMERRSEDTLRDYKNRTLIINVLYRKAVQEANVHPAHIDDVSSLFAKRIERSRSAAELNKVSLEMLRKYCMLVQNHSMSGYSEMIGQVINYIDFHLQEPLGLQYIAEKFSLNPSYLSRRFKSETGKNLRDYIGEKRIEKSLVYLTTTGIPVSEVAARVGIMDENYFSRIFKKAKQMSPREYRNIMQKEGQTGNL